MSRPREITDEQIAEIIKLHASGVSSVKIGDKLEYEHCTVLRYLKLQGIDTKQVKVKKEWKPQAKVRPFKQRTSGDYKKLLAKSLSREPVVDELNNYLGYSREIPKEKRISCERAIKGAVSSV